VFGGHFLFILFPRKTQDQLCYNHPDWQVGYLDKIIRWSLFDFDFFLIFHDGGAGEIIGFGGGPFGSQIIFGHDSRGEENDLNADDEPA